MKKILSVLLAVCTLLAVFSLCGCGAKSQTAMVINGVEVPQGVMNYYINAGRDYLTNYGVDLTDETGAMYMSMIEEQGVDIATEIAVVVDLAKKSGIEVDSSAVNDAMAEEKANFGGETEWNTWLTGYNMTESDVKWILEYQLLADALYNQLNADLTLSDTEIAEIYNANPDQYNTYKFAHILIQPEADDAGNSDDAAWAAAKATADDMLKQLKDGTAKFEDLAAANNPDSTQATGGDLGQYVSKTASPYVAEFSDAAFKLTEIGQLCDEPVKSSFGYHIIKLLDKNEGAEAARETIVEEQLGDERYARYSQAVDEAMQTAEVTMDYTRQYTYTPAEDDTDADTDTDTDADANTDTDSNTDTDEQVAELKLQTTN